MTYFYRTYGLTFSCDTPIPGLKEELDVSRRTHVCVELTSEPSWVLEALNLPSSVLQTIAASPETQDPAFVLTSLGEGRFFQLGYSDGTLFVVDGDATRIWGIAGYGQTIQDLSTYLLGPVMGFILRRRGITALHASAVCLEGRAIALAGEAGAGKSTAAAALALRGLPVLCEDIAALGQAEGEFAVEPGYPRVCLWPESVEMLMGHGGSLPRIAPNWEKCFFQLDGMQGKLEKQKRPLGAVYILSPREEANAPRIEEVAGREVLLELVQNTYMNWLLDRWQRAQEFELLSRLVSEVPVRRIVPHRDPSRISDFTELIVADATRLLASQISMGAAAGR